ncbi:peptide-N-glycosidase F-related protein [Elizabethkingia anophelis]|uniref:peptide-N-glycosidase F-related protein n=1 Tax=Elizabethkingia anophelis TaxID=1117645 RepID=UPI0024E08B78|nr:peptide-N-glycosidase F-related protein [Elizabethkingia anophelis]
MFSDNWGNIIYVRDGSFSLNNVNTFQHQLGALGCSANPINNQSPGNWSPDRAGWCPGMAVPTRIDVLNHSLIGSTFSYEYKFQNWTNNGTNGDAFYAISSFVIAKSNTPISAPVVTN